MDNKKEKKKKLTPPTHPTTIVLTICWPSKWIIYGSSYAMMGNNFLKEMFLFPLFICIHCDIDLCRWVFLFHCVIVKDVHNKSATRLKLCQVYNNHIRAGLFCFDGIEGINVVPSLIGAKSMIVDKL
jgi:hypothetical protein